MVLCDLALNCVEKKKKKRGSYGHFFKKWRNFTNKKMFSKFYTTEIQLIPRFCFKVKYDVILFRVLNLETFLINRTHFDQRQWRQFICIYISQLIIHLCIIQAGVSPHFVQNESVSLNYVVSDRNQCMISLVPCWTAWARGWGCRSTTRTGLDTEHVKNMDWSKDFF